MQDEYLELGSVETISKINYFKYAFQLHKSLLAPLEQITKNHGERICLKFGKTPIYLLLNPLDIKAVLVDKVAFFENSYDKMIPFLGQGLLTTNGDVWKSHRKIMQPFFTNESVKEYIKNFTENAKISIENIEKDKSKSAINFEQIMTELSLSFAANSFFGVSMKDFYDLFLDSLAIFKEDMVFKIKYPFKLVQLIRYDKKYKFKKALKKIDEFILTLINESSETKDNKNLLKLMSPIKDSKFIRDEVMTMLSAGHETTATLLTWCFYCLAKYPEVADELYDEILLYGSDDLEMKLDKFVNLSSFINEVMRLYPPVWYFQRRAKEDVNLNGIQIKKGDRVAVSQYFTHRSNKYWKNPEEFKISRFYTENYKDIKRYSFFPFGGGQHICIGQNFALMSVSVTLIHFIKKFKFALNNNKNIKFLPLVTLRPKNGMWLKVKNR